MFRLFNGGLLQQWREGVHPFSILPGVSTKTSSVMYTTLFEKGYTVEAGFVMSYADDVSWVYPASCVNAFAARADTFFLDADLVLATEKCRNMVSPQPQQHIHNAHLVVTILGLVDGHTLRCISGKIVICTTKETKIIEMLFISYCFFYFLKK
jgi:hypothetical protein